MTGRDDKQETAIVGASCLILQRYVGQVRVLPQRQFIDRHDKVARHRNFLHVYNRAIVIVFRRLTLYREMRSSHESGQTTTMLP